MTANALTCSFQEGKCPTECMNHAILLFSLPGTWESVKTNILPLSELAHRFLQYFVTFATVLKPLSRGFSLLGVSGN